MDLTEAWGGDVRAELLVTPGLGDNSYLIASGNEAVAVDPQRDIWRTLAAARRRGWAIRTVLETHVHNDYVSGARALSSVTGASLALPAGGGYEYPHDVAEDGSTVDVGQLQLTARHTPGHTPEHVSWEASHGSGPIAVFTGGSLLVGATGRTDLLGPRSTEDLARAQFRSVSLLGRLPGHVSVLPTHGAGSFCVANLPYAARTSTIADEWRQNPALSVGNEDDFAQRLIAEATRWPAYYRHMGALNRAGVPGPSRPPTPQMLSTTDFAAAIADGSWVVDGRDRMSFARDHVPGSVNIELNDAFATWVGWIVPFGHPVALVLPDPLGDSAYEAVTQLLRIGYDRVSGILGPGFGGWLDSGRAVARYPVGTMAELASTFRRQPDLRILDVRDPAELRDDGKIPGALEIFVGDLRDRIGTMDADKSYWVVCATGHRAAIAASLLDLAGIHCKLVARGGTVGWTDRLQALTQRAPHGAG